MEETEEHLCKVETKDDNFYLLLRKFSQESDGFDLDMTDGVSVWGTRVTDELLKNMATKIEMDVEDYARQTLKALTCQNSGSDCFIYQAAKKNSELEFNWKKQLADGIKFQLGSISLSLKEENKELMQKILNVAIRKIHEYKDNAMFTKSENEQLAKDRDNAITRLEKCVVLKEEMELDLFQKFVTVLNEKKAKIRRQQEAIEQQSKLLSTQAEDSDMLTNIVRNDARKNTSKKRDDDTDEESDQSHKHQMENQSEATTSKAGSSLFKDEEEDTGPVVKRRRKKQSKKPGSTPSKSVLPEVKATALKRNASNASSTTSNERQSSNITRKSSRKNKDAPTFPEDLEDLFGDMA